MKRLLAALLGACAVLAGCAGVPGSSPPHVVKHIRLGSTPHSRITPPQNADPHTIVDGFLNANAIDPARHISARLFLTPAARLRWSDSTATIVDDEHIGSYRHGRVVVTAHQVGTLDASGVYTPATQPIGSFRFRYPVSRVNGQFRIDDPYKGLLLTTDQFESAYRTPHPLYFFDLANKFLVPDSRWSALSGTALESWLVQQLADGPSASVQDAVNSDTMPSGIDPSELGVTTADDLTDIRIPGSSQLDGEARNQLAAQVALTLDDVAPNTRFQIIDSHRPLMVPSTGSTFFTAFDFSGASGPSTPAARVYYIRAGRIIDADTRQPVAGPLNRGTYGYLQSVALSQATPTSRLLAAGVASKHMVVGDAATGFQKLTIAGDDLTRPAWDPGQGEVWIGDGDKLYRVEYDGGAAKIATVPLQAQIGANFTITALRFSPEGDRLAMVIKPAGETNRTLWVGSVVRNAGQVRVEATQVSPAGVSITDVAWEESLKLTAIGRVASAGVIGAQIFETYADGADWTSNSTDTLPAPLQSITAMPGQNVWVSAQGLVFSQNGTLWDNPSNGSAPIYLE